MQDNVALIAVLEAVEPSPGDGALGPGGGALGGGGSGGGAGGGGGGNNRRTLICVANTHIHANKDLTDVKLWQVHTLLKGLEKIAAR